MKIDWSKYKNRKLEVIIMANKKQFDWKIWFKKFGINALVVIIAGLASVYGDNPYYLAIAPALKGLENYLKHNFNIYV